MVTMIPTDINGRWQLLLPEHRAVRPEWKTGWERERLNSMRLNIGLGDVIFDVGAEEGDMSALFASWVGALGGIALIEPNPRVWPNIRVIWEANGLAPPLGWWVGFASDETEASPPRLNVDQRPTFGWPACAWGDVIGDHGFRHLAEEADATPQIRLDELATRIPRSPDVVTMDVEGAELRVLRGAESLLSTCRPLVYVSVHPEFMRDLYGQTREQLIAWMADLGYQAEHLATDHEEHWAFWHPAGHTLQ